MIISTLPCETWATKTPVSHMLRYFFSTGNKFVGSNNTPRSKYQEMMTEILLYCLSHFFILNPCFVFIILCLSHIHTAVMCGCCRHSIILSKSNVATLYAGTLGTSVVLFHLLNLVGNVFCRTSYGWRGGNCHDASLLTIVSWNHAELGSYKSLKLLDTVHSSTYYNSSFVFEIILIVLWSKNYANMSKECNLKLEKYTRVMKFLFWICASSLVTRKLL